MLSSFFNAIHVFQCLRFSCFPARGTLITANQGLVLPEPDLQKIRVWSHQILICCTASCCTANQDCGVWVWGVTNAASI